ncbi:MAG: MogA/MoaB family molybdenum cofactor biosynthesis protein [Anaerovoracaceae bacterium]
MKYTAAVITMSDKGSKGQRKDTSGPAVQEILRAEGWEVVYNNMIPDDMETIKNELIKCTDGKDIWLIVTTGGTGFSRRDVTPEATQAVIERQVAGIPQAMRAESMRITPMGMLSRAEAGIRGGSLIINLPGSEKAAKECLAAVIKPIKHGIDVLRGESHDCARIHNKEEHKHG